MEIVSKRIQSGKVSTARDWRDDGSERCSENDRNLSRLAENAVWRFWCTFVFGLAVIFAWGVFVR